ncbi:MAG: hypothetical protein WCW02_01190 [Candidatus Buchananbacteria bacterium]
MPKIIICCDGSYNAVLRHGGGAAIFCEEYYPVKKSCLPNLLIFKENILSSCEMELEIALVALSSLQKFQATEILLIVDCLVVKEVVDQASNEISDLKGINFLSAKSYPLALRLQEEVKRTKVEVMIANEDYPTGNHHFSNLHKRVDVLAKEALHQKLNFSPF